jgi:hypothetical protein
VVVDVSRLEWADLKPVRGIHLPVQTHCERGKLVIHPQDQVLVIHHYLGTWEQLSARDDPRASKERSREVSGSADVLGPG